MVLAMAGFWQWKNAATKTTPGGGEMSSQSLVRFIRSNVLGLIAIFIALGGTAVAMQSGARPAHRKTAAVQIAPVADAFAGAEVAKKKKKVKRGPVGPQGPQGIQGPAGPTFGDSLSQSSNTAFTAQLLNGPTINTPVAGKLLAFGHLDSGQVGCNGGTGLVAAGLFVDGTFVPGTRWNMANGVVKSLTFAGVTDVSVPAGNHEVKWGALCVSGTAQSLASVQSGFGVIVLGG
jgi:hypothetical protein